MHNYANQCAIKACVSGEPGQHQCLRQGGKDDGGILEFSAPLVFWLYLFPLFVTLSPGLALGFYFSYLWTD